MNLITLEGELKKRLSYPYYQGGTPCDDWDQKIQFIYSTYYFEDLLEQLSMLDRPLINYALNRWYDFWSAQAIDQLFDTHPELISNKNKDDKLLDFSIKGFSFNHTSRIFPRNYRNSYRFAKAHKKELIEWLYQHQRQQGPTHLNNHLYLMLYNKDQGEHWKLKAEIGVLKKAIDEYITKFSEEQLIEIGSSLSDVIFVEQ